MTDPDPADEISQLFDVAGGEPDVLARLNSCVAELHAAQAAKTALRRFSPDQLRDALRRRSSRATS